ncbi:MAG: PAS domain S-box protein [Armatimonadetes bacterium]|nr:PAS domain S-box protein [Armatimonadota bacterium]
MLRAIMGAVSTGIAVVDAHTGEILASNERMAELLGGPISRHIRMAEWIEAKGFHPDGRRYLPEEWPSARAMRGEVVTAEEIAVERSDGTCVALSISAVPFRNPRGRVLAAVLVVEDISERKRIEGALRQANTELQAANRELDAVATELRASEEQMRALYEQTPAIVVLSHLDNGRYVRVNEAFEHVLGWSREEVVGRTSVEMGIFARPEEREHYANLVREHGRVRDLEATLHARDGRALTALLSGSAVEIGGEPYLITVAVEITERKRAEAALRRYELIAAHSRDIILFMRRDDGRLLEVNTAAVDAYGYSREELLGMTVHQLRASGAEEPTAEQMAEADARGILFESLHRRRDGSTFPVEISARGATIDGTRVLVSVIRDVTERKRAEEALRESEARFRQLANAMPQLVWTARPDGTADYYNERVREFRGFAQDADGNWLWQPVLHPEDVQPTVDAWEHAVRTGTIYQIAHRVQRADGTYRWYLSRGVPARDEEGRIVRWFGTATDIDDQKRAEERVRFLGEASAILASSLDSEKTLQRVARLAVPALADWAVLDLIGEGGAIRRAVVAHREGVSPEEVARFERLAPSPESPLPEAHALRTGETVFVCDSHTLSPPSWQGDEQNRALRALGVHSVIAAPVVAGGRVLGAITLMWAEPDRRPGPEERLLVEELGRRVGVALDYARLFQSEQRARAEAQEANQSKDQFVAMVSHELRNPLAAITAGMDLLRRSIPLEGRIGRAIEIVGRNAELQVRLVNDLLDLSRLNRGKLQLQRTPVNLQRVVDAAVHSYEAEAKDAGVALTSDAEASLWVDGDFDRLQQVVMNLIDNALKVTPAGGTVHVAAKAHNERHARITVEDTGVGMSQETLAHLFTLAHQGESGQRKGGLGIGLTLVKGIVERHGGRVWAESEGPNKGSRFTVELPLRESPQAPDLPPARLSSEMPASSEAE